MNTELRTNNGFSLTEVLLAIGTLAIGMIFIAGVFPVGIHFTTIATERTIAAIAADEAFAKIRLYGVDLADPNLTANNQIPFEAVTSTFIDPNEFFYPSTNAHLSEKQYCWSALCRRVALSNVQVTVFVSRKIKANARYWYRNPDGTLSFFGSLYPIPIPVKVFQIGPIRPDELLIMDVNPFDGVDEATFINDGYTIVDNETGQIYRVLERYADQPDTILLDRPWDVGISEQHLVWVVPPPTGGGRYPCIAVYQKIIRF